MVCFIVYLRSVLFNFGSSPIFQKLQSVTSYFAPGKIILVGLHLCSLGVHKVRWLVLVPQSACYSLG